MVTDCKNGFAFILEGQTEKEFYMAFLEFLCKKYSSQLVRIVDESDPDIVYHLKTDSGTTIIKFNVVGSVTQIPRVSNWVKTRCIQKYQISHNWCVLLCYDQDDYKPKISKFYEGDWKTLRDSLQGSCDVIDVAATADIEDVMLKDIQGVCNYLGCEIPKEKLKGSKGKAKMKNLFRDNGKTYHEAKRARPLIDNLDMEFIIATNILPLRNIEEMIFK